MDKCPSFFADQLFPEDGLIKGACTGWMVGWMVGWWKGKAQSWSNHMETNWHKSIRIRRQASEWLTIDSVLPILAGSSQVGVNPMKQQTWLVLASCLGTLVANGLGQRTPLAMAAWRQRMVMLQQRAARSNRMAQSNHQIVNQLRSTSGTGSGRWPDGVIYYTIDRSLGELFMMQLVRFYPPCLVLPQVARYRNTILSAMSRIEQNTCIQFVPRDANQRDYIRIVDGDGCVDWTRLISLLIQCFLFCFLFPNEPRSCHSKVGRAGGVQMVSLGDGCHDVGSTMHELCHAIGLYHEHMRYDRDQYLSIVWRNIMPTMYGQFQKIPYGRYHPVAQFDYNSIMIYGPDAFSKNDRDTMVPKWPGARIRESHFKTSLSQGDVININALYGCTP